MENKKLNNIGGLIVLVSIIVGISIAFYSSHLLLAHHNIINGGKVYQCEYGGRGNVGRMFIDSKFILNGKEIKCSTMFQISDLSVDDCQTYLVGHSFPVVYRPESPRNNVLLITLNDFKRYGYQFPDSLKWAEKYVK